MSDKSAVRYTHVAMGKWTQGPFALGSSSGQALGIELSQLVYGSRGPHVVGLCMAGIEAIDGPFMEQALYGLIHNVVEGSAIFIRGITSNDVERSCDLIAKGLERYLIIESDSGLRIAGLAVRPVDEPLIEALYEKKLSSAKEIADAYKMSLPNASIKLKNLVAKGLALRVEKTAPSGGYEYRYFPIRTPDGYQP